MNNACNTLCEEAPEFMAQGVTENVCDSLKNNTGLNPALDVLKDNEEALKEALDCLIGQMPGKAETYENCQWQEFMQVFFPNLYNMLKAMICSDAGAWANGGGDCDCGVLALAVQGIEDEIGSGTLDTTAQTLIGAINELKGINDGTEQTIELDIPNTNANIASTTSATIYLTRIGKIVICQYVGVINPTAAATQTLIGAAGTIPAAFRTSHNAFATVVGLTSFDVTAQARFDYGNDGSIKASFTNTGTREYHHSIVWTV